MALACTKPQDRATRGIDCSPLEEGSSLEFGPIDDGFGWFSFGDEAPSALRGTQASEVGGQNNPPTPIDDVPTIAGPCNAWEQIAPDNPGMPLTGHLRFHHAGHTSWGSGFGQALSFRDPEALPPDLTDSLNIPPPRDGSEWEGIAFWAQSAHQKDRTVQVEIQTAQSAKPYDGAVAYLEENLRIRTCLAAEYGQELPEQLVEQHPCDCREPAESDGALNARVNPDGTITLEGSEPRPGDCGNVFRQQVTISERWQLYLLPFREFWQEARPNRVSDGLDASRIYALGLRVDIEKDVDFLSSQWVFYRHDDYEPPERDDAASECSAPDWDISWPTPDPDMGGGGEGGATDLATLQADAEDKCGPQD